MEAVILAGGFGHRLRSVVNNVPKPMAPIAGRPFLELLLDRLVDARFSHAVLSTGYMHETIEDHFGISYRGMPLSYAVEETPLGTGGGLRNAFTRLQGNEAVVLNGDTLFEVDFDSLDTFFHNRKTRLAMILRRVDDISRYGAVVTGDDGQIVRFIEKQELPKGPRAGTINGGVLMVERSLVEEKPLGEPFSFEKEILQTKFQEEPFYAYPSDAYFIDIGIPEDYQTLRERYLRV